MRRPLWIPWRWWRRAVQLALLVAFLWLFRRTELSVDQLISGDGLLPGGENLFFRIDPLAGAAAMLGARQFIAAFWPAAVVLGLTLVFGRFFCGWVCPLGALLDVFHRLLRPLARRTNKWIALLFSNSPGPTARGEIAKQFRYVLLFAVLVAALFAFPLVGFFDPFALLLRGLAFWFDPMLFKGAESAFSHFSEGWTPEVLQPFAEKHLLPFRAAVFQLAGFSAALLGVIFLLEFVARRFWCRFLCPAGAMFSLLARWSWVKRTPSGVCGSCGDCVSMCRMKALDAATGFSPADCTLCMDCVVGCPKRIAGFVFRRKKRLSKNKPSPPAPLPHAGEGSFAKKSNHAPRPVDLSRRSALLDIALGAAAPGVAAIVQKVHPRPLDPFLIRPPGAGDESTFLSLCIRCGECMKVCPSNVLQPAMLEAGVQGVFSPKLLPRHIFEQSNCEYSCTLCGQVCPTGAIPRLDEEAKHAQPVGKAYFDHARCLPWAENTSCVRCEEMCPIADKAIKLLPATTVRDKSGAEIEIQRPYVDRDRCVGCGICESNCPLPGESAIRVRRVDAPDPGTETLLKAAGRKT